MAFDIVFGINSSENNALTKNVEAIVTLNGVLREGTSVIDPDFLVEASIEDIIQCNYLTVASFNRKYFIKNISMDITGLIRVTAHVDVLSSFAEEIRANKAIFRRQESQRGYNLYINDGSLVAYQNPYVLTQPFPSGFTGAGFVFVVAGGTAGS